MSLLQVQKFRGKTGDNMADKNYLHTAYAYSADGTDGFTIVYPNLNLLNFKSGFTFGKYLDWPTGMLIVNNIQRGTFGYVPVTPNAKYTLSANWKNGSSFSLFGFNSNADSSATTIFSGVSNTWIPLSNSGQYITKNTTVTIPSGINFIRMSWISTETLTLQNLLDAKPKLELGTTATTWMPSASEVTTADWPKYVGTYVDTNQTSSTEPSKYVWDEMKYRVYLDGVPVGGSKLLSFDLENLKAGTSYNVQVNQINGNDESDKSESVAFKTTLTK
ncbi:fibronectin type III domain-containing protein [Lactococcus lactis]|uniref:fibronectin type III domain-containing protein n=1 Tax=Lactococcus lactis TaxID=1358 RepID=UPI0025A2A20E|nr:fibronectin type III domain-containing protein [Lactococcus lactis]MDM7537393.1 fibronectin type III domain-containing protein [Lactococcus lactis]